MTALNDKITALSSYCKDSSIYISPGICPKSIPGRGLGIYATRPLKRGERLAFVPTKCIFTTKNIPTSFLSREARKGLAVHAQIAAFFAFASKEALATYQPWIDTWPKLDDFANTMPVFWGDALTQSLKFSYNSSTAVDTTRGAQEPHSRKRRRTQSSDNLHARTASSTTTKPCSSNLFLPPGLTSTWHSSPTLPPSSPLAKMLAKLASHIDSLQPYFPFLNDSEAMAAFLHSWCLTNTRCFYYHPYASAIPAPVDPNECMALMPFLDLFNHSDATDTCRVRFTARGFEVTTRRKYAVGEEVEVCYGEHGQEGLWAEYGFMLSGGGSRGEDQPGDERSANIINRFDKVEFDDIVWSDDRLGQAEKSLLETHGYLGHYSMTVADGMCYRTQVAALLIVLGEKDWVVNVIQGKDNKLHPTYDRAVSATTDIMRMWCDEMIRICQRKVHELDTMNDGEILRGFATSTLVDENLQQSPETKLASASERKILCAVRWQEILETVEAGRDMLGDG